MRRVQLYGRLVWICFISLFAPTTTVTSRVEDTLAELRALSGK